MAHLLYYSSSNSNCSSPVEEQMQMGGTFTNEASDFDAPDLNALLEELIPQSDLPEARELATEEVSLRQPHFIHPSVVTSMLDFPDIDLSGLTEQSSVPRHIEPLVAAIYPLNLLTRAAPPGIIPAPDSPSPTSTTTSHPPYHAPHISQGQHNCHLIESALGIRPCTRSLPAGPDFSFLRRKIPTRGGRSAANAISQEIDALYPDENADPESSKEPGHCSRQTQDVGAEPSLWQRPGQSY